jgi:hypothetical protein
VALSRRRLATFCPSGSQRALAYLATGSLPPLHLLRSILSITLSTSACLALGVLIGAGIA